VVKAEERLWLHTAIGSSTVYDIKRGYGFIQQLGHRLSMI